MMKTKLFAVILAANSYVLAAGQNQPPSDKNSAASVAKQTVVVSVLDKDGWAVPQINQSAFSVFDDKVEQEIIAFGDQDAPLSLGILFDVSPSVLRENLNAVRSSMKGLMDFTRLSNDGNEYFVIGFSDRVQLLTDWTKDTNSLSGGLSQLPNLQTNASEGTHLNDALYEGLNKVQTGNNTRKVILLVTDGIDYGSRRKFGELQSMLKERDVLLYILAICSEDAVGFDSHKLIELENAAYATGGRSFYFNKPSSRSEKKVDLSVIHEMLERLAFELRHQYTIVYRPSNAVPGKWRRIKVKVTLQRDPHRQIKDIYIRHRDGYFSAPRNGP